MCLVAVAWRMHPHWPLALIANRDELHARPTAPAGFDPEAPDVYGGRDLVQGGGWLQLSRRGRLAAVTNVRSGPGADAAPRSRGWLVRDFARGQGDGAEGYAAALAAQARDYGRFNLLLHEPGRLVFAGNHPRFATHPVSPGLHAMSNGAFDAPWPKSNLASRALARLASFFGQLVGAFADSLPSLTATRWGQEQRSTRSKQHSRADQS